MVDFVIAVLASVAATILVALLAKWFWPNFKDKCLYKGVRVDGLWDITEVRDGETVKVGRTELKQQGCRLTGKGTRTKTRDGKHSERKFHYNGTISGNQVTLIFEDAQGIGFDTGTNVFIVYNDSKTLIGMATFHGKIENKIVSEPRIWLKAVS